MLTSTRPRIRGARVLAPALLLLVALVLALAVPGWAGPAPKTKRVSVDSSGAQATGGGSYNPVLSAGGRFVAFESYATNLVGGDTNGQYDIFVRDLKTGKTKRVSVDSSGAEATGGASRRPSISADGRFVAFRSDATNLVGGDTNGYGDIFVRDLKTGKTKRVSVDSSGAQAADGDSYNPSISAGGRFVAFTSYATNLVGGDTNGYGDIFVRDLKNHTTKRVSIDSSGAQALGESSYNPSISADGGFVTFQSYATNLVHHDTNGFQDIFLRDLSAHKTTRISVTSHGHQANGASYFIDPAISADGRFVTFISQATNLSPKATDSYEDDFAHDRKTGKTTLVSVNNAGFEGNSHSYDPAISANGRWVAFPSNSTNLVGGDTNTYTDIFVRGPLH
jgi:WD40-like Beta Propeller Repeat